MERKYSFLDKVKREILTSFVPRSEKIELLYNCSLLKNKDLNILITGATGCGKSSTINALLNSEVASIGTGVDPETMEITKYHLDNLTLWDSPGLGDGKAADIRHSKSIISKLHERDSSGNLLIDLVVVVLDCSSRDLGTSYELINSVIIPNLGEDREKKLVIALNQGDMAMKGRHWDSELNIPEKELFEFLEKKVSSVKRRIKEATYLDTNPIYYSAGFKECDSEQDESYNLDKLRREIVRCAISENEIDNLEASVHNKIVNRIHGQLKLENTVFTSLESVIREFTKALSSVFSNISKESK